MNLDVHHYFHTDPSDRILLQTILRKVNAIMVSQNEAEVRLVAAGAKIDKIFGEVSAVIALVAELRAQIENAGALSAGVTAALEAVETKLDGVDMLNPDAP